MVIDGDSAGSRRLEECRGGGMEGDSECQNA